MERESKPIEGTPFKRHELLCGSTTELQNWAGMLCPVLPAGYRNEIRVEGMRIICEPKPVVAAEPAEPPTKQDETRLDELHSMSDADLATYAAELGVSFPKRSTKIEKAGLVLAKEQERAAQAQ